MNETLTPQKQETTGNPVHDLDSMVSWFAVHRDKYPGYDDVAKRARTDLLKVSEHDNEEQDTKEARLELRPLRPGTDPDSVYYANEPMEEGTYALLSQIYRATEAEMVEDKSSYDEESGDSYSVYLAKVGPEEIFITEKRSDGVTTLQASADAPKQSAEARIGSLLVVS